MTSTFGHSIRNIHRSATANVAIVPLAFGLCHCGANFEPVAPASVDAGEAAAPDAAAVYIVPVPGAPAPEGGLTALPPVADAGLPDSTSAFDASTGDVNTVDASDASTDAAALDVAAHCDSTKDPKDDPCVIADAYAVFVAAGAPADAGSAYGTVANPAPTVTQGLALAAMNGKSRVYVCGGTYTENVAIAFGVGLYGGFTCSPGAQGPSWQWTAATTTVTAPSAVSGGSFFRALTIQSPNAPVLIEDMTFASPDAVGQDGLGNGISTIAAFVDGSTVSFVRSALSAGKGASGADGVTGVRVSAGGILPTNYQPANQPSVAPAGGFKVPGSITCNYVDPTRLPLAPDSSAGGGPVNPLVANASGNGTSNPPPVISASSPADAYGLGQGDGTDVPESGEDGPARPGGVAATSAGTLTASAGWTTAAGGDGPPGQPGQGGGGFNGCYADDPEGGGSGGCGGAGGTGGGAGGSSIALLSVASTISISESTLRAGGGGNGGAGGAGQDGQAGGPGSVGECGTPSGSGGNGAGGSGGAGGSAGVSVGILYSQSALPTFSTADTSITVGPAGAPGAGGAPGRGPGTAGNPGQAGYVSSQASARSALAP